MYYNIPQHLIFALSLMGTAEIPGIKSNPEIDKWLKIVGLPEDDAIPHCAAFVNYCLHAVDIQGTGSGLAKSLLDWGYGCEFQVGAVVVISRGKDVWKGHVGFILDESAGKLCILGANQMDRVGVNYYAADRLLGYRWHRDIRTISLPRPVIL